MNQTTVKATILVVDDTPANIDVLRGILKPLYHVKVATNGERALKIVNTSPPPDMILLDVMMPGMDGYQVCEQLKANIDSKKIPVIFVTAKTEETDEERGFSAGGVDYITKPVSPTLVLARVATHIELFNQATMLTRLVDERTKELHETRQQVIQRLGRAAEYKDNETGLHVIRMSHYSKIIARGLGMSEDFCQLLLNAAPMHDIGKIGIPDAILLKPGKLDKQEWQVMQTHPTMGARIIGEQSSELLKMAHQVALTHHEKFNGQGYPNQLMGKDIPIAARIVAVADVFDALTTARPYKTAWSIEDSLDFIKQQSGQHFDPDIVAVFLQCMPDILEIKRQNEET
ncbi:MAG: putative two-component system response regulator [Phenylobacterium sp.]|jgi:putative two-component system response regulator